MVEAESLVISIDLPQLFTEIGGDVGGLRHPLMQGPKPEITGSSRVVSFGNAYFLTMIRHPALPVRHNRAIWHSE